MSRYIDERGRRAFNYLKYLKSVKGGGRKICRNHIYVIRGKTKEKGEKEGNRVEKKEKRGKKEGNRVKKIREKNMEKAPHNWVPFFLYEKKLTARHEILYVICM